jgi:hypothetical protein
MRVVANTSRAAGGYNNRWFDSLLRDSAVWLVVVSHDQNHESLV